MKRFEIARLIDDVSRMVTPVAGLDAPTNPESLTLRNLLSALLAICSRDCSALGLSLTAQHVNRMRLRLDPDWPRVTDAEWQQFGQEFARRIVDESRGRLFLYVEPARQNLYENPIQWFEDGKPVLAKYPKARADVVDACKCCAFGQWTAAVFHAMRILEHGLRGMARGTKAKLPDRAVWHTWIKVLEDHVAALRKQTPRTPALGRAIDRYSAAATQFRHFKDAWRNHSMHAGPSYGELEARKVLNGVKYFMRDLV